MPYAGFFSLAALYGGCPATGGNWHTTSRFTSWDCPWRKAVLRSRWKRSQPCGLLATHSKSWSCGSRRIGLLVILLPVLETSQYPSGLCLNRLHCLSVFNRPVKKFFGLTLIISMRSETSCSIQDFVLKMFCFSKLCVVSSYFQSWCFFSCTRSHLGLYSCCFSTGGHTAYQHVSGLTVNSSWDFKLCAAWIVGHFIEA